MPTGFYDFYSNLLDTANEANDILENGSGKAEPGDSIIRQNAQYEQAVEIPYQLEVAKDAFERRFFIFSRRRQKRHRRLHVRRTWMPLRM